MLAVAVGRAREWETVGRRRFLAVELDVLPAAAASAFPMAAGHSWVEGQTLFPSVEEAAKTIWKTALGGSMTETRAGDSEIS